jgi:glycosyltransferase involved in cell wall biosynthesis
VAPDVSVVIPTHDRRDLLGRTLRTILWQQGVELEVIVIDDGSIDGTEDAVAELADQRIRYVRNETAKGVASARNRGVEEAQAGWIAFVDDDDLWAADKLSEQLTAALREDCPWAYAGAVKIDGTERVVGGRPPPSPEWVARRLPRWNAVPGGCSGVMATRMLLDEVGGFDPKLVNLADWDLWIRFVREAPPARAGRPLVAYRWHAGNSSLDTDLILQEARVIQGRYEVPLDWGAIHHYLAHLNVRSGNRGRALRHFATAVAKGEPGSARDLAWLIRRRMKARRALERVGAEPEIVAWRAEAEEWLRAVRI